MLLFVSTHQEIYFINNPLYLTYFINTFRETVRRLIVPKGFICPTGGMKHGTPKGDIKGGAPMGAETGREMPTAPTGVGNGEIPTGAIKAGEPIPTIAGEGQLRAAIKGDGPALSMNGLFIPMRGLACKGHGVPTLTNPFAIGLAFRPIC